MAKVKPKPAPKPAPRKAVVVKPKAKAKPKAKEQIIRRRGKTRTITTPGTPGSPGVRENQRDPFLSADDQWDIGEEEQGFNDEIGSAQQDWETRLAELPQTLDDIKHSAMSTRERQSESAIDRGIFQSSINEMALTDINVAETVSTEAAKSLVANAQSELERIKHDIDTTRRPALYVKAAARGRENAEEWNTSQDWQSEPTEGTPAKTVTDYDLKTPGVQNKQQANRNAAARARQQPTKPGGGRGTQAGQPNRPGAPRQAKIVQRPQPSKPRRPERVTSVNGRRR